MLTAAPMTATAITSRILLSTSAPLSYEPIRRFQSRARRRFWFFPLDMRRGLTRTRPPPFRFLTPARTRGPAGALLLDQPRRSGTRPSLPRSGLVELDRGRCARRSARVAGGDGERVE